MIRFVRTRLIRHIAILKSALAPKNKLEEGKAVNPWEADLARLANERKHEAPPPPAAQPDEISLFVNELTKAVKKEDLLVTDTAPQPAKPRRAGDGTVTDLKSWWGDAVATWDPEVDGKNVNSSDQRNKVRGAKWFDKGPQFDK